MDFTYFFAALIGLTIGVLSTVVFLVKKRTSKRHLIGWAFGSSLLANGLFLIRWIAASDAPLWFIGLDFAFIATFTLIGCAIGIIPILSVRYLWRKTTGFKA